MPRPQSPRPHGPVPNGPGPAGPPASGDFGVYVHIPFCQHQCAYCTFYTLPAREADAAQERLLAAIEREWRLRVSPRLARGERLRTLYLGGGTPSDSPVGSLASLLRAFAAELEGGLRALDEVTVECNPESASTELLDRLRELGVGRLSLGVQALDDADLRRLDRRATAVINRAALERVAARFATWNADLIVGVPGSRRERLVRSLGELARVGAPHLSFYCLELPQERARRLGAPGDAHSDDHKASLYELAASWVESHGYEHYEISNAARPGHEAHHNSAYWSGREYVGLGPGAHSLEAGVRRANRADLQAYTGALAAGAQPPAHHERLTPQMLRSERLFLALRLRKGLDWQEEGLERHRELLERLARAGLARLDERRLSLTARGWLVSDSIVLQLVTKLEPDPSRVDKHPGAWLHWV
jgi:oxygen-independent coproporphyrinogen-3 oxidase